MWVAAGKQPDLEKRVGVGGYGYPAMVALNAKKGAYAPLKSGFEVKPPLHLYHPKLLSSLSP